MVEIFTQTELSEALWKGLDAGQRQRLREASVAVAGLGGLGSNIAAWLARLGVGRLLLVDFDRVELSNLNRQYYFLDEVGEYKAQALYKRLLKINPYGDYRPLVARITSESLPTLLDGYDVICEALDKAESKAMLVNGVMSALPRVKLVAASGLAGLASGNSIAAHKISDRFYVCGDGVSSMDALPLCGARVGLCAAHQALTAARIILDLEK